MSDKIFLFLFICLLGLQISCQTERATSSDNINQPVTEVTISDDDIQKLFIDSGLGDGDGNLEKLMALPRERAIAVVQKLKDTGIKKGERGYQSEYQSPGLKIKSAYFLWKLGVEADANEKYLVDTAGSKDFGIKFEALGYLQVITEKGKKEYLPMILKAAPEANGHYAEEMHDFLVYELKNSTKVFLIYPSKESSKVRKSVYEFISYTPEMMGKDDFETIKANVENLKTDKETKKTAEEFLKEVSKKQ